MRFLWPSVGILFLTACLAARAEETQPATKTGAPETKTAKPSEREEKRDDDKAAAPKRKPLEMPKPPVYRKLNAKQLQQIIESGNATIVDNNDPKRSKVSQIQGTTLQLDYDKIAEAAKKKLLPEDKGTMLVFYSLNNHCPASRYAASEASVLGYQNVYVYHDGIEGWERWRPRAGTGDASEPTGGGEAKPDEKPADKF